MQKRPCGKKPSPSSLSDLSSNHAPLATTHAANDFDAHHNHQVVRRWSKGGSSFSGVVKPKRPMFCNTLQTLRPCRPCRPALISCSLAGQVSCNIAALCTLHVAIPMPLLVCCERLPCRSLVHPRPSFPIHSHLPSHLPSRSFTSKGHDFPS